MLVWRLGTTSQSVMVIVQHSTASWVDGFVNCMIYSQSMGQYLLPYYYYYKSDTPFRTRKAGMTNRLLSCNKRANIQIKSKKRLKGQGVTKGNNNQTRSMYITSKKVQKLTILVRNHFVSTSARIIATSWRTCENAPAKKLVRNRKQKAGKSTISCISRHCAKCHRTKRRYVFKLLLNVCFKIIPPHLPTSIALPTSHD